MSSLESILDEERMTPRYEKRMQVGKERTAHVLNIVRIASQGLARQRRIEEANSIRNA